MSKTQYQYSLAEELAADEAKEFLLTRDERDGREEELLTYSVAHLEALYRERFSADPCEHYELIKRYCTSCGAYIEPDYDI